MNSRHEFTVASSADVYRGKVMALRTDEVVMPGGRLAVREITEHPGAVAIVALDAQDRVMLVHQYRHAVARRLWELPAGLLDHAGEDPVDAASRELVEEAGLTATAWSVLVDVVPSPGFSDESVRVFLARGLAEVERPEAVGDEEADLTTRWTPLADAVAMALDGTIVNGITLAGLLAAQEVLRGTGVGRPTHAPWVDRSSRFGARS